MSATQQEKVVRAFNRAARYCSREKAIQLIAMNSRYSITQVRDALNGTPTPARFQA